jgi:hypothetical protein
MVIGSIKQFQLSSKDKDFLLENCSELKLKDKFIREQAGWKLIITDSEQELLIARLSDLLVSNGLNENDEPNAKGLETEHLIDVFNPYTK